MYIAQNINFMKKYFFVFFLSLFIISCSDSNNSIENLTIAQHIELIKNHNGKIEIGFEELPEVSQNYISSLEDNITTELILHAEDLGYEVKIKRESRSLISLLNPRLKASGFKKAAIATKTAANPTKL